MGWSEFNLTQKCAQQARGGHGRQNWLAATPAGVTAALFDETKKREMGVHFGILLLPVGKYYVKINGAFAAVTILDKQVTEL